jgi:hypothetical protein
MSLKYRIDYRSPEEAFEKIANFTKKESGWKPILACEFISRGVPTIIEDHGVDNTGSPIRGSNPKLKDSDYKAIFYPNTEKKEERIIECKGIPTICVEKFTYKVSALKGALKQNAWIFTPRENCYYMFGKKAIKRMLTLETPFPFFPFGNKPCIQIQTRLGENVPDDRRWEWYIENDFIFQYNWTKSAKLLIEKYRKLIIY